MKRDLDGLARRKYDLVIVGGGITGAAIARDAALRGLSIALLEAQDFSHATSAATSKLVHGGLRYLRTLDLGLVHESLAERRIWLRIAPHMVYPLPFVLPIHDGFAASLAFHAGLTLYDILAIDRQSSGNRGARIPSHRWIDRKEAVARASVLSGCEFRGAMLYYDCQMFAPERLAFECLVDAAAHGAQLANYADVIELESASRFGAIEGVTVEDQMNGRRHRVRAEMVVNATGPWADIALAKWHVKQSSVKLLRSKGVHIITRALTTDHALTLPTGTGHLFVLPWRGCSLIGTTDTAFEGPPDSVRPTCGELEGLLATLNRALPGARLAVTDILYAYAGVRPLIAPVSAVSTYKTSRRAEIVDHAREGGPARLISAIGGKWTTSRRLAAQAVDLVCLKLGRPALVPRTAELCLPGGQIERFLSFVTRLAGEHPMLSPASVHFLARNYGSLAEEMLSLYRENRALLEPLAPEVPQIGAQAAYAVDHEMALTLDDVVFRRTGLGTLGFPGETAIARTTAVMAARLGWDERECARQREIVRASFAVAAQAKAAFNA